MKSDHPLFLNFLRASLLFGGLYRLYPLIAGPDALVQFFVTEDGYLMLTVARNLAIGNGLSVSDGTIPTNGVQPLATLISALPYLVTGGAKLASLIGITLIQAAISVAGLWAVYAWSKGVLAAQCDDQVWPWLVAVLWFVGPLPLLHTMNGLETGLYVFMVAATITVFGRITARGGAYTVKDQMVLGALCGIVFLSRNDGAFFVTALFLVRFLHVLISGQLSFRKAVLEALPPGILSLVLAAPWLVHNKIFFGSIIPISGPAQSLNATFAANLPAVPVKVFETMFPMLPVPTSLEDNPALAITAVTIVTLIVLLFLWRSIKTRNLFRIALIGYAVYALMIISYYGLFFGAEHFLSRYFAPLAPLLIIAVLSLMLDLCGLWRSQGGRILAWLGFGAVLLSVGLLIRLIPPGVREQGHFQVVNWVESNIPNEVWVGAVQTGTLGYWHDRTINLDGKVNPEALAARRATGNVLAYVIESPIDYVVDWVGVASWAHNTEAGFRDDFELLVEDRVRNLAVLRRRGL